MAYLRNMNRNGFTLVEVLISIAVSSVVIFGLINISKYLSNSQVESENNVAVNQLNLEINSYLSKQSDCNANFSTKGFGTNLPLDGIYKCVQSSPSITDICITAGSGTLKIPAQNSSWDASVTKISNRLRIINISYTYSGHATEHQRGRLTLNVVAEFKKLDNTIKTINLSYPVNVVSYGGSIIGCDSSLQTVKNCEGNWSPCTASCGGGTETYTVTGIKNVYGENCPFNNGDTRACNSGACVPNINCVGAWGACSVACGGGTQTYTITTPQSGTGSSCSSTNGATQACNTNACCIVTYGTAYRVESNCFEVTPNGIMWPGCTISKYCDNDFVYPYTNSCTGPGEDHTYTYGQYVGCY